jgi:hypothetical protein
VNTTYTDYTPGIEGFSNEIETLSVEKVFSRAKKILNL